MAEFKHPTPTDPGTYWAKWRIASEGTRNGDELTPSDKWEAVQVHVNDTHGKVGEPEYFYVSVPGVEQTQWLDQFVWGPMIPQFGNWSHHHVKRGTNYQVIGFARAQCTLVPISDGDLLTLYSGEHGEFSVRPPAEFNDGRFRQIKEKLKYPG